MSKETHSPEQVELRIRQIHDSLAEIYAKAINLGQFDYQNEIKGRTKKPQVKFDETTISSAFWNHHLVGHCLALAYAEIDRSQHLGIPLDETIINNYQRKTMEATSSWVRHHGIKTILEQTSLQICLGFSGLSAGQRIMIYLWNYTRMYLN